MPDEKYTEQFLTALSDDQLSDLLASLKADGEPQETEYELLTRIDAEVARRRAPPPS